MTQGMALSYLLRYYDLTKDESSLPILEKVAFFLLQRQEDGGTISTTPEGYTWIEEYPNSKRSPQVLNGFVNGFIGLKEYTMFFPEDTLALRILDETYDGIVNSLEYFDSNTWSYYNRKKKKISNKYLRYQVYEMLHLYEIFGDEIFDKQMRIWAVMALGKNVKSKSKVYKFPKHEMSSPATTYANGEIKGMLKAECLVLSGDSLEAKTYSKKQLKKDLRFKVKSKKQKGYKSVFYKYECNDSLTADYITLDNDSAINNWKIMMYDKNTPKTKISYLYKDSLALALLLTENTRINHLIIELQVPKTETRATEKFSFYDSKKVKAPFFSHYKSDPLILSTDSTYNITSRAVQSKKSVIFYKYLSKDDDVNSGKWKAKNTLKETFTPEKNGQYQFMVVYDYDSPLSSLAEFKVNAIKIQE